MLTRLVRFLQRLCGDEGQDLIEYALLAGLVAISAVAALMALGPSIMTLYEFAVNELAGVF